MKKIKIIVTITSFFVCFQMGFSQEAKIELPEITTEVVGVSVEAEEDSLPNFATVIEIPSSSEDLIPVLPEEDIPENKNQLQELKEPSKFHGDGMIGGGYPSVLKGEFNLYQLDELNPLELNFFHNSVYGFASKDLFSGYSDRNTKINLEKTFVLGNFKFDLQGAFDTLGTGLQAKSEDFTEINQNDLYGFVQGEWKPVSVFTIGLNTGANYYTRFLDATKSFVGNTGANKWITELKLISMDPTLFFKWEDFGFTAMLSGKYNFSYDVEHIFEDSNSLHRGQITAEFGWKNDVAKILGEVGIAFGNRFNQNKFIIPFTIKAALDLPTYFSSRNVKIEIKGGLDSKPTLINSKEIFYKYSAFNSLPQEQSDWYGQLDVVIPIKNSFTGKANVQYRQTAFDNGIWQPNYQNGLNGCLYGYEFDSRQLFTTEFNVNYNYKMFSIGGLWKANWMDVPVLEHSQLIGLELGANSLEGRWCAEVAIKFPIISLYESVPIVDFDAFISVSKSVRVMLNIEDIVKLVSVRTRQYAGEYVARGGAASLLVKYIF